MDRNTILMIGCFDTKAEDFAYLHSCLKQNGLHVISINTGVRGSTDQFPVDITADDVANQADTSLEDLRDSNDRGLVVEKMGLGARKIIAELAREGKIHGAIGMGGGGGTYITLAAMQSIPFGIPKLCLSTVATKDLSRQIGVKDITLMPSVVDVAGLNKISRLLILQAAGAISGMMGVKSTAQFDSKGTIAISMFGNTTPCVDKCTAILREKSYEVLAFHSVGTGGRTMEYLIEEGHIDAVLDITTTELADELCEGICTAGPTRLTAASKMSIPQVVVPGCIDMVNYGHKDTVPEKYKSRLLYSWAPDVTLMRTNEEENKVLGEIIAKKLNKSQGHVAVLLPLKGISIISVKGGIFHAPQSDKVLFDSIKKHLKNSIPILEVDNNINDEAFAERAVHTLLEMMDK